MSSPVFNPIEHNRIQNEKEAAVRAGTPAPEKPKEPAKAAAEEPDDEGHAPKLPRSVRRELNQLRRDNGVLQGKLEAYMEMGLTPKQAQDKIDGEAQPKADEDPEPQRDKFATDAEYNRAVGRWDARQETKKELAQRDESGKSKADSEAFYANVRAMDQKAAEDAKLFSDWDDVMQQSVEDAESGKGPIFNLQSHPTLCGLIATSDCRAAVAYHLAKNPDELEKLLKLGPQELIRPFARLEERVSTLYAKEEKKPEEEKPKTPKLPKPSEAAAPRGGSAPAGDVSPTLGDGKTMNPAWKEQRNIREGLRR